VPKLPSAAQLLSCGEPACIKKVLMAVIFMAALL
jgi:hypothetical protein